MGTGPFLERIHAEETERGRIVEQLWKRTAIDRFRVAISRPTETLIFLDLLPTENGRKLVTEFLQGMSSPAQSMDAEELTHFLTTLDSDPEERVQQLITDSGNLIEVRPELAWNRARRAVSSLGRADLPGGVKDASLRTEAHLNLAKIAFRILALGDEGSLSASELLETGASAARDANEPTLSDLFEALSGYQTAPDKLKAECFRNLIQRVIAAGRLPSWVTLSLRRWYQEWMEKLPQAATNREWGVDICKELPSFLVAVGNPTERALDIANRIRLEGAEMLLQEKQFQQAWQIADLISPPPIAVKAACYEGLGQYREAATRFESIGDLNGALRNYRFLGDIGKATSILDRFEHHPDKELLSWLRQFLQKVQQTPEKLNSLLTEAEQRLLHQLLVRHSIISEAT